MGVARDTADNRQSTAGEQHSNQQRQDSPVAAHGCGGREGKLQNKTERVHYPTTATAQNSG